MKSTAGSEKAVKPRGGSWKPGQSGNPKGRQPEAQSWAGVLRDVTDRTAEELADMAGGKTTELGRALLSLPKGQPLKTLIALRVMAAVMYEPTSGVLRWLMDAENVAELEDRIAALEALRSR